MRWIEFAWHGSGTRSYCYLTEDKCAVLASRAEYRGRHRWTRREYVHVGSFRPSMASTVQRCLPRYSALRSITYLRLRAQLWCMAQSKGAAGYHPLEKIRPRLAQQTKVGLSASTVRVPIFCEAKNGRVAQQPLLFAELRPFQGDDTRSRPARSMPVCFIGAARE